jgi:hypothetical protein
MTGDLTVSEPGVTTKISPLPYAATVARLTSMLDAKGARLAGSDALVAG